MLAWSAEGKHSPEQTNVMLRWGQCPPHRQPQDPCLSHLEQQHPTPFPSSFLSLFYFVPGTSHRGVFVHLVACCLPVSPQGSMREVLALLDVRMGYVSWMNQYTDSGREPMGPAESCTGRPGIPRKEGGGGERGLKGSLPARGGEEKEEEEEMEEMEEETSGPAIRAHLCLRQ